MAAPKAPVNILNPSCFNPALLSPLIFPIKLAPINTASKGFSYASPLAIKSYKLNAPSIAEPKVPPPPPASEIGLGVVS